MNFVDTTLLNNKHHRVNSNSRQLGKANYLVHSIHVQRRGIQTVLGLPVDVLWSAAAGRNPRSGAVVDVEPISRPIDAAAHHFSLNGVPSHHVVLQLTNCRSYT